VATGPSVEDFYCCFPQGGKIWFSGLHSTNGGLVGYYDPVNNSFTYQYSGNVSYFRYLTIRAYNNEYNKWLLTALGNSGGGVYVTTNPFDFTQYRLLLSQPMVNVAVGRNYVVRLYPDNNYKIYVYLDQISSDWSTYTQGSLIYQSSNSGPSGWMKYMEASICGGKIWVADAVYNSSINAAVYTVYYAPLDNPTSWTSVLTTPGFGGGRETHGNVSCIADKYVLVSTVGSGGSGRIYILDTNGNVIWYVNEIYHNEFMSVNLGNLIGLSTQNAAVSGIEAQVLKLDEDNPYLNVTVSGYTINVSNAYPNSTVYACRVHSVDGQRYSQYQSFDKCISATANASGSATITVDEAGKWIIVS
jgi:hypothetical protein